MATISDSSMIQPEGKVGGFTFYKLNGKIIMRSLPRGPHKNKTNPTALQKVYQNRLAEINAYLKPLKLVLNFGYQNFLGQKTGVNWAHTDLSTKGYNHIATPRINPAYLQISRGSLVGAVEAKVIREVEGVRISWIDNSIEANANPLDRVSVLLNHPEVKRHIWVKEVGERKDLSVLIPLSAKDQELEWEIYLVLHRPLNKKKILISDSQYLGRR
ncbi:hypothetical protein SAMN04489724_1079 [Algoriphagus locisalis]|uniref:Uncharacterized protein n=1 Tax=Algoriphagus locisalis TaxID=305507 RepID=A0A1I6YLB8_9BACT|nr:DUF6266 family protein [Algoriphagus locisalis]SFT51192.1 hypothetical protein SAMN04489724_1079 [Algoriphagus locisalis]